MEPAKSLFVQSLQRLQNGGNALVLGNGNQKLHFPWEFPYFTRYWELGELNDEGSKNNNQKLQIVMRFNNRQPFLCRKRFGDGEVLLAAAPLHEDIAWSSNFPDLLNYPIFIQELVYSILKDRSELHTHKPGEPIRFQPINPDQTPIFPITITTPNGESLAETGTQWPFEYKNTWKTGVYELNHNKDHLSYELVEEQRTELDLTPLTNEDLSLLHQFFPNLQTISTLPSTDSQLRNSLSRIEMKKYLITILLILAMVEMAVSISQRSPNGPFRSDPFQNRADLKN